jgi:hypothetical protein
MIESRVMRWVGQEERMADTINRLADKIFAGKTEVEGQFGKRMGRCEDNIVLDLGETMSEGVDWIHLAQGRIMVGSSEHDNHHSTIDGTFD